MTSKIAKKLDHSFSTLQEESLDQEEMQQLESRALKDSIDADWRLPKFESLKYDYKPLKEIKPKNGFLREQSLDFRLDQDLDYYSYKKDVVF